VCQPPCLVLPMTLGRHSAVLSLCEGSAHLLRMMKCRLARLCPALLLRWCALSCV
jgi:hypothetical protein